MKSPKIKCRTILWYLVFSGMIVFILLFVNINIAIIAMVRHETVGGLRPYECQVESPNVTSPHHTARPGTFDWSEIDQGLLLGKAVDKKSGNEFLKNSSFI